MYARKVIYGMMMIGAILLMSCSQDDVTFEATPDKGVAISFACELSESEDTDGTNDGMSGTRAVIGHSGAMNSEDLYYTGFGVFASQNAGGLPDMMYNQQVTFTFVGDLTNPLKGFWSYQPLKYWPVQSSLSNFSVCAYAPYTEEPPLIASGGSPEDNDNTGIVGISPNTEKPYLWYRPSNKPENMVDLLWCWDQPRAVPAATSTSTAGTLNMTMRHALARLEINMKLAAAPASGTKVLIEKIVLTGAMAKEGRLHLDEQTTEGEGSSKKYYPVWSNQTLEASTITCTSKEGDASSYGIIDPSIRYIEGLPYEWQPDGLKDGSADDLATTEVDESLRNVLYSVDRKTYVYLIPQETLSLTVKVKYHKKTAGGDTSGWKTTTASNITVGCPLHGDDHPLHGNTTYTLNLTLSDI